MSDQENNKEILLNELQIFIKQFDKIKFEEANLPYRDFVAKHNFELIKNKFNFEKIYIKYDEVELFIRQNLLKQLENKNIKIEEYKNQNTNNYLVVDKDFDVRQLFWIINHV